MANSAPAEAGEPIKSQGDPDWPYDNIIPLSCRRLPDPDIAELCGLGIQADIAARIRRGPSDPEWLAPLLTHLPPDTVRDLISDPRNIGIHESDEAERERLIRRAAWHHEIEARSRLPEELDSYFVVRNFGGKARVCHWDDRGQFVQQSFSEFQNAHAEKIITWLDANGKLHSGPLAKNWLHRQATPRYERVEFLPGQAAPSRVMNLWRGWPCRDAPRHRLNSDGVAVPVEIASEADLGAEPPGCGRFLEHVRMNMCRGDEAVYEYLLGWMADAVLNVHRTSEVALVLRGPQGSGKTFFAGRFLEFFSPHTLTLNRPGQLTGNFNAHLLDKCMVFADEAFFAGHRQDANSLKTLITGGDIFIEPKGVDGFMAPKRFRLIISSNDEHVIRAERDDRRFLMLDVDAGEHNQDRAYFQAIHDEWGEGGRVALFRWLRGRYWRNILETGAWDVGMRPATAALGRQKDLSLPPAERAVHNMLREGEVPCDFEARQRESTIFVATRLLAEAERLDQTQETALGAVLRVIAGRGAKSVREYLGEGRSRRQHRGYWLPPLEECRRRWEAHLARSVEWPGDVQTWGLEAQPRRENDDVMPF